MIIGGIFSAFQGMTGMDQTGGTMTINWAEMARGMGMGVAFAAAGGIILTIGAIMLVFNLENDLGKKVLYLALVASIVVSIIVAIFLSSAYNELADELDEIPEEEQEEEFAKGASEISQIQGLDMISSVVLLVGYIIPYNRIKKGELKPEAPPMSPYGMGPYPPQYPYGPYPQYPPYQYPYQQPPYQPPGEQQVPGEEKAQQEPSEIGAQQPMAVSPVPMETTRCTSCDTQIPKGSAICPVCGKGQ